MDLMAYMATLPQTIVHPKFQQIWQSRVGLVLHLLASGFGGAGSGVFWWSAEGAGVGMYQFSPKAPSGLFRSGSLRMQIPSLRGRALGRTSLLYRSSFF